jgi:5-methylcytosine-specific restriction endonuclease McrA
VSAAEHAAIYAAWKQDGMLPLTMSATTPKTKLIVEFEAKGQFSSSADQGDIKIVLAAVRQDSLILGYWYFDSKGKPWVWELTQEGYKENPEKAKKCFDCHKEYRQANKSSIAARDKAYNLANKDNIQKRRKNYRIANKDVIAIKDRKYYLSNKDARAVYIRNWQKANPEKLFDIQNRRRVKELENKTFFITNKFLIKLYNSSCSFCRSNEKIQADHIIPVSRGGYHGEGNLQPLCKSCNLSKGNKTMMEWRLRKMKQNG